MKKCLCYKSRLEVVVLCCRERVEPCPFAYFQGSTALRIIICPNPHVLPVLVDSYARISNIVVDMLCLERSPTVCNTPWGSLTHGSKDVKTVVRSHTILPSYLSPTVFREARLPLQHDWFGVSGLAVGSDPSAPARSEKMPRQTSRALFRPPETKKQGNDQSALESSHPIPPRTAQLRTKH